MSEEEKQIHLYMHSKNELGLATLCVEKDKEIERLNKINKKATRHIEILLELALEQDSENVNLIDRLKGILDILKGVELTENDKKQIKWLKEEFKVGVNKE